ncbi:MAG: hypothetical protein QOH41_252 [Blastocatellia bacterium]|jgi:tyrosinase|nr:hypothetical protein [Blastocatellia bacterium]
MKESNFSRRGFIKGLGIAGGFSLLGSTVDAQVLRKYLMRKTCKDAGAIIRKSFKTLTAAELTAFKNGVSVMKARSVANSNDPTGWTYQAAIHGTSATPVQTAWSTCQHNTTFFLSWHRMYICFFERILRKASGMPGLGLPYWNYSDSADPNARFLPAAFRDATSTLYTSNRNAAINAGTGQLSGGAVSLASVIPGPTGFYPFTNNINGTPHGAVHNGVGGGMSSFNTAGLDPIFWLHHCNIDRLWNRWLAGGGGRSNPPATDTTWHNTNFTFFDENGAQVQMKGADIVDPKNSMCRSCYDEEAVFVIWDLLPWDFKYRELLIGYYRKPLVLDTRRLKFVIDLNEKAKEVFARALQTAKPEDELNFRLNFEGARADKPLEFFYEVYLNLPENAVDPNYKMESYAENLSFFGADQKHSMEKEELKFGVNITNALKRLKNLGEAKTLSVTLVPTGLVSKDEKRLPIRSDAKVSVDQITLSVQVREK